MAEPVEVAIEIALLDKAIAFAQAQSPVLTISLPNGVKVGGGAYVPPAAAPSARWLRASILPAPTITTGIADNSFNQHYGFLQIDVLQGLGGGTAPMKRIISAIAAYFPVGLAMSQDGFAIQIRSMSMKRVVSEGPMMKDGDAWMMIPVSVPYLSFARPA